MRRRAFALLLGTMGLAACQSSNTGAPVPINQAPAQSLTGPVTGGPPGEAGQIAILLPLSGKLAEIGRPMLKAAQLALQVPGSPVMEVKDTGGTPEGAARAADEAIRGGAKMILGPVTSPETAQVAPLARQASIPVLAFTNDHSQAQPGIWTLGITPGQQVRRLVGAAQQAGKMPVCALLPDNDFGKAMGDELTRVAAAQGQQAPWVRLVGSGKDDITNAVAELAGLGDAEHPLPCGAVMLAATGNELRTFARAFSDAKIDRSKVQILGPALWVEPASGSATFTGAWFAMPDPGARGDMVRDFSAKYRELAPPRADLAYDAASIARVLGGQRRMNAGGLTQPMGFAGVDGWFAMMPDGQVRRGLAVFRVDRSRPTKIGEAPTGPAPGS